MNERGQLVFLLPFESFLNRMTVHLFGARSSPACAGYALRRVAKDNVVSVSPEAVSTVLENFYVDDCLKSVNSVDAAIDLAKEVVLLLRSGGFCLTKFNSNCRDFLKAMDPSDLAPGFKDLALDGLPGGLSLIHI